MADTLINVYVRSAPLEKHSVPLRVSLTVLSVGVARGAYVVGSPSLYGS